MTYAIQPGDTLGGIAARNNVTTQALMVANSLTQDDVYTLRPGRELIIPTEANPAVSSVQNGVTAIATLAPLPTVAPTATSAPLRSYVIQSGDTLLGIAQANGVSLDALLQANNLTREDARSLRVGQSLALPGQGPVFAPAPLAQARQGNFRLEAPQLRTPENNTQVSCATDYILTWLPVPSIQTTDRYVLHLGFVNATATDGTAAITWVLQQSQPANNPSWTTDSDLCGLAPQQLGRQWRWYVEVVEDRNGRAVPVSPASPLWGFSWQ